MEDNLTLKAKLEEVQKLAERRNKIEIFLYSSNHGDLKLWASMGTAINIKRTEEELSKRIEDYFETELEKVDKKLNELLK